MKNTAIKEGGTARVFSPKKIKTNLRDGGTCLWVPQDETKLTTKTIEKNGTYRAKDDEAYGYSKVIVKGAKSESEVRLTDKTFATNGTRKASDEGFYGYGRVTVNVPGGGSYTDPDTGTTHTPEPSTNVGSAVVGKDEDGDDTVIKINENHELEETKLADHIKIDVLPNKLEYHDKESIVITGAVVRGYLKDGTPYKNNSMEESIITHNNLIVAPSVAVLDESSAKEYGTIDLSELEYQNYTTPFIFYRANVNVPYYDHRRADNYSYSVSSGYIYPVPTGVYCVSDSPAQLNIIYEKTESRERELRGPLQISGVEVEIYVYGTTAITNEAQTEVNPAQNYNNALYRDLARVCYGKGKISGGQQIGIGWARDGDAKVLHDYFVISVEGE